MHLRRLCSIVVLVFLVFLAGCSRGSSTLETTLSAAVKDRRLSEKKMEIILKEYDSLRSEDRDKARLYVEQIKTAVEVGGDSTHIDVARRMVLRSTLTL